MYAQSTVLLKCGTVGVVDGSVEVGDTVTASLWTEDARFIDVRGEVIEVLIPADNA